MSLLSPLPLRPIVLLRLLWLLISLRLSRVANLIGWRISSLLCLLRLVLFCMLDAHIFFLCGAETV